MLRDNRNSNLSLTSVILPKLLKTIPQNAGNSIFEKSEIKHFQGSMSPDPPPLKRFSHLALTPSDSEITDPLPDKYCPIPVNNKVNVNF